MIKKILSIVFFLVGLILLFSGIAENDLLEIVSAIFYILFAVSYYLANRNDETNKFQYLSNIFLLGFIVTFVYQLVF